MDEYEDRQLWWLWHPGDELFSGYGLTVEPGHKEYLVGLLMVDRPQPVDPAWLTLVEEVFGDYRLYPMTTGEERGIACQMWIEEGSLSYLRQVTMPKAAAIKAVLLPLLSDLPNPQFTLYWDEESRLWRSTFYLGKERATAAPSRPSKAPLFPLGQVVATPGALEALEEAGQGPEVFLRRHVHGEWGDLDLHDIQENEYSLKHGLRLLSAYRTRNGTKLWVITEWDRSITTLLLPREY